MKCIIFHNFEINFHKFRRKLLNGSNWDHVTRVICTNTYSMLLLLWFSKVEPTWSRCWCKNTDSFMQNLLRCIFTTMYLGIHNLRPFYFSNTPVMMLVLLMFVQFSGTEYWCYSKHLCLRIVHEYYVHLLFKTQIKGNIPVNMQNSIIVAI